MERFWRGKNQTLESSRHYRQVRGVARLISVERKGIKLKPTNSCVRKNWLAAIVFSLLLFDDHSLAWSTEGEDSLRAGIVKVDITPDKPVKMSGYAGRKDPSTGVHDRLYARIVAFQSSSQRLVLVSTDLIGFYNTYEPIRDAICDRFDLEPRELFLSGTHTHSGPTPTLGEDRHPNNLEYTQNLKAKLLEAIGLAIEKIHPVRMGAGRGYSPVGSNRRGATRRLDTAGPESLRPVRQRGLGDETRDPRRRARRSVV
jgi:hypothetical protein